MSVPPAESGLTAESPAPDGSEQRMARTALEETKIALGGMTCGHCVETVEGALRSVAGVREASADLPTQTAVVKFDPSTAAVPEMESAVAAAGYAPRRSAGLVSLEPNPRFEPPATAVKPQPEPAPEEHMLAIDGMTCASCVRSVEQASESVPGVSACEVNLADRTARVWIEPNRAAVSDVVSAIRASGYGARIARPESADPDRAPDSLRRRLTVSAALTAPLLVLAMADGMLQFPGSVWVQFGLALPVVVYGGAPFYSAAWLAARHGRVDMNTLIAMGTGAAFLYSIVATVAPGLVSASAGGVYYETAAAILTLVLLGRVLEARASRRTSASIGKLLALQAKSVHVRREGVEIEIPLERVVVGDEVVVRPGERIPVDGTVVEGEGAVDESHVTGESVPSDKRRGSRVTSGSLNQNGFLVFRAESVGSDTALSRIIDFVRRAQGSKAPAAKLADRIAAVFVPIVFGIATLTFVIWMVAGPPDDRLRSAWTSAVSVLIIACPCAVGLATPAALAVAIGRAAESGILIRDGAALEAAENVDTVVFDKTGTLTQGRLRVTDAVAFGSMDSEELLRIAGGIERHSEHPVARAIAEARPGFGGAISDFKELPGAGASARVDGEEWILGKRELLTDRGADTSAAQPELDGFSKQGKTIVLAARDGQLAGVIALRDTVREDSVAAATALKAQGRRVLMISGDSAPVAKAVASEAGIGEVIAPVKPLDKSKAIEQLQSTGHTVAMVGDGINDAPALTQADVGIAIGAGTDIAIESATIVLVRSAPSDVGRAIELSRRTRSTIRQNYWWAFGYNVLGVPVAAGILYPWTGMLLSPILASAAMAFSSLSVTFNSLRLNRAIAPRRAA